MQIKKRNLSNRIVISDNINYLILDDHQGNEVARAIIDKEDYPKVLAVGSKFGMQKHKNKSKRYVISRGGRLHHVILNTKNLTDHINGNPLDNRKNNLRICSVNQNARNSKRPINNTSGFKGVTWHIHVKKWKATIGVNSQNIHLGYFDNKIEAARAYNQAAKKYHGEFARFNRIAQ